MFGSYSKFLVPGDIIELSPDYVIPCDVLLINGIFLNN